MCHWPVPARVDQAQAGIPVAEMATMIDGDLMHPVPVRAHLVLERLGLGTSEAKTIHGDERLGQDEA